ncbi:MAG: hypothetical protein RL095_4058 [Verrucomicrobiota bacterium]|jgi:hypothetical protein
MNFHYVTEHDQALAELSRSGLAWPESGEPLFFTTSAGFFALAFQQSGFYREDEEEETRDCGLIILAEPGRQAESAKKLLLEHLAEISACDGSDDSGD